MIDLMMLAISLQRLITAKAVGVIDRALPGLLFDMLHQVTSAHSFNNTSVNMAFSFKKPENKALSSSTTTTLAFALSAEVSLVEFDLSAKPPGLKLSRVVETFSQML